MTEAAAAGPLSVVGKARPRIDGPFKVTGVAQYTSDYSFPGMLYAVPVGATIANGTIEAIDTARARQMPGVLAVFKHGDLAGMSPITPISRLSTWTSCGRRSMTTSCATGAST